MLRLVVLVALAAALAACDPLADRAPPCLVDVTSVYKLRSGLDLLVVVDESPSMAAARGDAWASKMHEMARTMDGIRYTGLPALHVAVVSADPARGGAFVSPEACGVRGAYLVDERHDDGRHERNYDGELVDVLDCLLANLRTDGSPTAAPLAAIEAALDGSRAESAGFVRRDSELAVLVISAQDDCSGPGGADAPADPLACVAEAVLCSEGPAAVPGEHTGCVPWASPRVHSVDRYQTFLRGLAASTRQLTFGVAAGPSHRFTVDDSPALVPGCTGASGESALPAVRLHALADRLLLGRHDSICDAEWDAFWNSVGSRFSPVESTPCLDKASLADVAPATPGVQLDCAVSDIYEPGDLDERERPLPPCPMLDDARPDPAFAQTCWYVDPALTCTGTWPAVGLEVQIVRHEDVPVPTYVRARCTALECPIAEEVR